MGEGNSKLVKHFPMLTETRYANDTMVLANTIEELQELIERIRVVSDEAGYESS